ncbi:MAG TPA: hypothetical protein VIG30_04905 [Ktedonobacterales bacterium]|jgi:hypothetical protein
MFGWRRAAARPVRVALVPGTLRDQPPVTSSSPHAAAHGSKQIVAYALAHSPTWTNHLALAEPRGRAANLQTAPAHPGVLPLAANPLPAPLPDSLR